ncbi:inorganic triphosphatase [Erythrobacter donghaensis]|uniref:CYTH domain-containing protein n=1 Tax=Erythrobacter donghaensis TaxID=267135 RepID=UPI0009C0EAE4|nr:CYTH domain-containing protein [Erythrobacter donghaensis]
MSLAQTEIELKLAVTEDSLPAIVKHCDNLYSASRRKFLKSWYFDTHDLRFRRANVGLRVRLADERHIQTIKCRSAKTSSLFERAEFECALETDRPTKQSVKGTPIAEMTGDLDFDNEITEIFTIAVERSIYDVELSGRGNVQICVDSGVVEVSSARIPISEIEIELIDGDPQAIFAQARVFASRWPVWPRSKTKPDFGYQSLEQHSPQISALSDEWPQSLFDAIARFDAPVEAYQGWGDFARDLSATSLPRAIRDELRQKQPPSPLSAGSWAIETLQFAHFPNESGLDREHSS